MRLGRGPIDSDVPVLGLPALDDLLGGMWWGENVVWRHPGGVEGESLTGTLLAGIAGVPVFETIVLAAGTATALAIPESAVTIARPAACADGEGGLAGRVARQAGLMHAAVIVDVAEWTDGTRQECLADLLELARWVLTQPVVAVWLIPPDPSYGAVRDALLDVAQCSLDMQDGKIRIEKADGRAADIRGAALSYEKAADGTFAVTGLSTASLLGRGLRAVRQERGWSQADLGRLVGVSPSAISQAERGQHSLSLDTVLEVASRLGITVDELVRGPRPKYAVSRHRPGREMSAVVIDGSALGVQALLVKVPPGGSASPGMSHEAPVGVLVGAGIVQVVLDDDRPVLRDGEALTVTAGTVRSCRNLGDGEALLFWLTRSRP